MTNKEAISNLEELYPVVSEEKKQAIDKAIKALNENRACFSCKHNNKQFSQMPCKVCDDTLNKWEAETND